MFFTIVKLIYLPARCFTVITDTLMLKALWLNTGSKVHVNEDKSIKTMMDMNRKMNRVISTTPPTPTPDLTLVFGEGYN